MVKNSMINEVYRIVNGQDAVACTPHTVNALILGDIGYDHCGPMVPITKYTNCDNKDENIHTRKMLWIKGQSQDASCLVRDDNLGSRQGIHPTQDGTAAEHILQGGVSHHMEDKYYQGMGTCAGSAAFAGSNLVTLGEYNMMEAKDISV